MRQKITVAYCIWIAIIGASAATAQDASMGERIYMERCAVCHGETGSGDGIVGELFAQKPSDLKLLSKNNGGTFPFLETYRAIDGRADIPAHGRSGLPVWGRYFMQEAIDNPAINEKNARYITEGRILSLVFYLQTIQVD